MEYSEKVKGLKDSLLLLSDEDRIDAINEINKELFGINPLGYEPVGCVQWVSASMVVANDYNPNSVAPPEMKLLEHSIREDGYTQPIVTWLREDGIYEVVDGFHRNRVGREILDISERIHGKLPVVVINSEKSGKNNRIASTIRHNRARGKHQINAMSDIVIELKNRNWKNSRIARELGMDEDEILRLCQITGLEELFKDDDFSMSWEIGSSNDEFQYLTDEVEFETIKNTRTVNTNDPDRIFHTFDKWECAKAGFYNTTVDGMTKEQAENEYARLLSNEDEFRAALEGVTSEWKHSCEHYLTNKAMNRIAWLGQASLCYAKGIPSVFRGGFNLLSEEQQKKANEIAFEYLNKWLKENSLEQTSFDDALSVGRQVEIY